MWAGLTVFRGSVGRRPILRQIWGLTLFIVPAVLGAQQRAPKVVLRGTVVDSAGERIAYTNVLLDARTRVVADDSGRFELSVDSARAISLTLRRISFVEQKVPVVAMRDTAIRVVLAYSVEVAPAELAAGRGVRSLDRNGFYQRLAQRGADANIRHFITPEDLELRRPYRASQMLEGVPGVRMRRDSGGDWAVMGPARCPMTVYLDRSRVNSLSQRDIPVFIDEIVSGPALAALEVYPSTVTPPPEYPPIDGTCGVLLIWTK